MVSVTGGPAGTGATKTGGKTAIVVAPIIVAAALLAAWQLVSSMEEAVRQVISSPALVGRALWAYLHGPLGSDVTTSLSEAGLGWLIALLAGVPLGILAARVWLIDKMLMPLLELVRPISPIAWLGLLVVWVGIGFTSKVAIIVVFSFFTILLSAYDAAKNVDPTLLAAARLLGTSRRWTGWRVVLPATLPRVVAGARFATTAAWGGTLVAELTGATGGVGYRMFLEGANGNAAGVIAVMLVVGVVGLAVDMLFLGASRALLRRFVD